LWVEKSEYDSIQERLEEVEHSTCPDKEVFAKLKSEHDDGMCIEKVVHESLQEQFDSTKEEHSSRLDKETITGLQKLQAEHDEGLWVGQTELDSLQQRFDAMELEHSTCPDKGLCVAQANFVAVEEEKERLKNLCNGKVDRSELEGARRQVDEWKSNHGAKKCVGKGAFNTLNGQFRAVLKEHGECLSVDELRRLRMESQHDNFIDQATYDGVVAQHQHCLTTEELNQLRDTSTQHQCPNTEELNQLRDTATQHQQCLSAAEVQMLQDFHSNHNNCVDRGSYDIVFNAHEGCE
jgi:hypothetical protein